MKRRTIRKIIVIAVAVGVGFPLYQHWAAEKEYEYTQDFFYHLTELFLGRAEKNQISNGRVYANELEGWNQMTKERVGRLYSDYRKESGSAINQSIDLIDTLMNEVYTLRSETVPFIEPLYSERMLDTGTLKDEAEYQWRMETLDKLTQYGLNYKKRVLKICEGFRTDVVSSDLPEEYRIYIWDDWADNIHKYITKMGPQIETFDHIADSYKRLFTFLHESPNSFYIDEDDGKVVFTNSRRILEYQRLLYATGIDWKT